MTLSYCNFIVFQWLISMAARRAGVRMCLFVSYFKDIYSFLPEYMAHTIQPVRRYALFNNFSSKFKNFRIEYYI